MFLTFGLLSGCTTETVSDRDGSARELVTCTDMKACNAKAAKICRGKYDVLNTSNEITRDATGITTKINWVVKCRR